MSDTNSSHRGYGVGAFFGAIATGITELGMKRNVGAAGGRLGRGAVLGGHPIEPGARSTAGDDSGFVDQDDTEKLYSVAAGRESEGSSSREKGGGSVQGAGTAEIPRDLEQEARGPQAVNFPDATVGYSGHQPRRQQEGQEDDSYDHAHQQDRRSIAQDSGKETHSKGPEEADEPAHVDTTRNDADRTGGEGDDTQTDEGVSEGNLYASADAPTAH